MRSVALGVAILWVVVALAVMTRVSFVSVAANVLIVFIALSGAAFLALARVRQTRYRIFTVLATIAISAAYLGTLLVLSWGLALDPWIKADLELRQGALICRAVYFGERTELKVFETFPLGIERRLSDDLFWMIRQNQSPACAHTCDATKVLTYGAADDHHQDDPRQQLGRNSSLSIKIQFDIIYIMRN